MIRGRGHGFYKPPQYVTGRIDDFPLLPETPIDIAPRPILSPPAPAPLARQQCGGPAVPTQILDVAAQPDPVEQKAAAETKSADEQLQEATDSLKRIMKKVNAHDRNDPEISTAAPPEPRPARSRRNPPRARKTARRSSRQLADDAAIKNLSPRERHSRLCSICHHPDRDAIEEEFIHWHNPNDTRYDYEVSRAALYRHAHAVGLFARRERNLRSALGHMVQRVMNVAPTSDSILRAIRAYSCLNRDGQWTEPPAHVVVSSGSAVYPAARALPPILNVLPAAKIRNRARAEEGKTQVRRSKARQSTRNTRTDRKRRK
ncbi:MAG: hypothetical protein P4L00_02175 [Candidatus Acidoferrales bacterium]|nr:hypothetical protein [Candidatus Acidoferrales bacterium]